MWMLLHNYISPERDTIWALTSSLSLDSDSSYIICRQQSRHDFLMKWAIVATGASSSTVVTFSLVEGNCGPCGAAGNPNCRKSALLPPGCCLPEPQSVCTLMKSSSMTRPTTKGRDMFWDIGIGCISILSALCRVAQPYWARVALATSRLKPCLLLFASDILGSK